ncbi:hypothetical protein ACFL51_02230, partial [Myxococcota bacterium]
PFTTIQEAYDVVVPGGQIAVAAGEYEERLVIEKEVRLTGRCAELVTIRGAWLVEPRPPVLIAGGGSGSTIHGVSLTGDAEGLYVDGAVEITVTEVQITDAGNYGLLARDADISVDRVVASANQAAGVVLQGTDAELTVVVVRDTLPRSSNSRAGYGLLADCTPSTGICGSLRLDHALLEANHTAGIELFGTEAELSSVVVRGTQPRQSDDTFGCGIQAACDPETDACGSLRLEHALLRANHSGGITLFGVGAELSSVVTRDTLPDQSDGTGGKGIHATCSIETGVCGSLRIDHALLLANHQGSIVIYNTETELSSVIVRDTLPQQSDGMFGFGLFAACTGDTGACGGLQLDQILLQDNRDSGISLVNTGAELSSVVVSGTLPQQSDGMYGVGLMAVCGSTTGICGSLRLDHTLVRANQTAGIALVGTDAWLSSVVVQDTLPQQSTGTSGHGLMVGCSPGLGPCSSLRLDHAQLRANHSCGIILSGSGSELSSVVIQDTLPDQSDSTGGYGLQASCDPNTGVCGSLLLSDSLIRRSEMIGMYVHGVPTGLSGVAIKDTRQNEEGFFAGEFGTGVFAMCYEDTFDCGPLDMTGCLVDSSFTAGVAVQAVSGSVQGSVVRDVLPCALDGAYGYGIQVEGIPGAPPTTFDVSNSVIEDAFLAGLLYYLAEGTVSGSQITGGQFTVVMNQGANPIIQDDNDLSGTIESEPTWANRDPAPTPPPATPADIGM